MENSTEIRKIEIDQDSLKDLDTTRKWSMFMAILGFIGIGILFIGGLIAGLFLSVFNTNSPIPGFGGPLVFIIILIFTVIYFFPVLYLFRFSKHTSNAVKTLDKIELQKAIRYLKLYYVYIGILLVVFISMYLVAFIAAGASAAFLKILG
jgi:MFS family permease